MERATARGSSRTDGLDRRRTADEAQPVTKGGKLVRNQRSHARENRHIGALIERVLRASEPDLAEARTLPGDPVVLSYDQMAAFVVSAPPASRQALPQLVRRQREQAKRVAAYRAARAAAVRATPPARARTEPEGLLFGPRGQTPPSYHPPMSPSLPVPLLPPPADARVRWLGTRSALKEEGRRMRHVCSREHGVDDGSRNRPTTTMTRISF
jgi:hypothetical protein